MENITKDTNTLVDNEVTDIFEELSSGPEQPIPTENPDHPSVGHISDISGNKKGFTDEASANDMPDPYHYQYQEGYNWHADADMTFAAPDYQCYDQFSHPYNRSPSHGFPPYIDPQQTEIGLQPTGYWSNNEHSPSSMDMQPVTITNNDGYGYNQAQIDMNPATPTNSNGYGYTQTTPTAGNPHNEYSTQTESTPAHTETRPRFGNTRIQRQTANSSAAGYIAASIFVMLFCCMPLGIVALILAVLGQHTQNRQQALSRRLNSASVSIVGIIFGIFGWTYIIYFQLLGGPIPVTRA